MNRSIFSTMTFSGMAALGQFVRALAGLVNALKDRREVRHLAEFDDRMLKDIGLTRGDVQSALSEPLLHNPSWVLVRNAKRRPPGEGARPLARQVRPVVPMVRPAKGCA